MTRISLDRNDRHQIFLSLNMVSFSHFQDRFFGVEDVDDACSFDSDATTSGNLTVHEDADDDVWGNLFKKMPMMMFGSRRCR